MTDQTEREALLRLHHEDCTCPRLHPHMVDLILAAGFRQISAKPDLESAEGPTPRTVTTVEELRALDPGVVILDRDGMALQREGSDWSGGGRWWDSGQIAFPATVLAPAIDPDDPELIGMVARVMAVHRITGVWFPPARCSCGEETGENYADWNAWEAHVAREVSAALKAVAQ